MARHSFEITTVLNNYGQPRTLFLDIETSISRNRLRIRLVDMRGSCVGEGRYLLNLLSDAQKEHPVALLARFYERPHIQSDRYGYTLGTKLIPAQVASITEHWSAYGYPPGVNPENGEPDLEQLEILRSNTPPIEEEVEHVETRAYGEAGKAKIEAIRIEAQATLTELPYTYYYDFLTNEWVLRIPSPALLQRNLHDTPGSSDPAEGERFALYRHQSSPFSFYYTTDPTNFPEYEGRRYLIYHRVRRELEGQIELLPEWVIRNNRSRYYHLENNGAPFYADLQTYPTRPLRTSPNRSAALVNLPVGSPSFTCGSCHEEYSTAHVVRHRRSGSTLCETCYTEQGRFSSVQSYHSSDRNHTFVGDDAAPYKGLYFGIEFEIDEGSDKDDLAIDLYKLWNKNVYVEGDGSLSDDGVEIVLPPMSPSAVMSDERIPQTLKLARDYGFVGQDASASCGMHVSVSRSWFNDTSLDLFQRIFLYYGSEFRALSQRSKGWDYAEYPPLSSDERRKIKSADLRATYYWGDGDKYCAVATRSCGKRVEIRFFGMSIREESVYAKLELIFNVCHWTANVGTIPERFEDLIFCQPTKYLVPYATKYLNRAGINFVLDPHVVKEEVVKTEVETLNFVS